MTITQISATYGGKLNLGDYNSAHLELTLTAVLEPGEDPAQAQGALFDEARNQVRAKALELFAKRGARIDQIFAGLPVEVQQQIKE